MKLAVKFGTLQWMILVLTVVAGVIHLFLPGILFILNGLGYLGLLGLYFIQFRFLPIKREWARWGLMAFAALTIFLYIVMQVQSGGAFLSALGIFTQIVEAALIYCLWRDK